MKDPNYELILKATHATLLTEKANSVMSRAIRIGSTPQHYRDLGFPDLPLAMKVSNLDKILFRHGIPLSLLEGIYLTLQHPKAIFRSRSHSRETNAVVLTFETNHLGPLVVILHANKSLGRTSINELTSIYAKEDKAFEKVWRKEGLLLWEPESSLLAVPRQAQIENRLRDTTVRLYLP